MQNTNNQYRAFSEDDEQWESEQPSDTDIDYRFEGFEIVVNDKIMLTPVNQTGNDR